jgi:hypothetical protein
MNEFAGAWELLSFTEHQPDGEILYPYGQDAIGLLIYDSSGHMSVQIMRPDRPALTPDNLQQADRREIEATLNGFTAYFGRYEIDEKERVIIHTIEGHLLASSVGKILKRKYEFSGDQLILSPAATRKVVWKRIR